MHATAVSGRNLLAPKISEVEFSMRLLKGAIQRSVGALGYEVRRKAEPAQPPKSCESPRPRKSYERLPEHVRNAVGRPIYLDVGARGGVRKCWYELLEAGLIQIIAAEPDEREYQKLQASQPGVAFFPWALGDEEGNKTLYVTAHPMCSSLLEPDMNVLAEFPIKVVFVVVGETNVDVRRYDQLVARGEAPAPCFLKLDVQGYEWNVLKGFGNTLDQVLAVELESHLRPLYKGQRTAFEIYDYLISRGFILRHVQQQGPFEGEFIEANFFFSRRSKGLDAVQRARLSLWETLNDIPALPTLPSLAGILNQA